MYVFIALLLVNGGGVLYALIDEVAIDSYLEMKSIPTFISLAFGCFLAEKAWNGYKIIYSYYSIENLRRNSNFWYKV